MCNEIWVPISGFEDTYEISNIGRIKSHRAHTGRDEKGHILSNKNSKGDYLRIVLFDINDKNRRRSVSIHILVYENFIGKIPSGCEIHHKNGDKQDNRVENLELLTHKEHNELTHKQKPHICDGMNHYNKYVKPREICMFDFDGNYLATFPNAKTAEAVTGVCGRNILQVASKEKYGNGLMRKQAGGYVWRYRDELDENQMYKLRE